MDPYIPSNIILDENGDSLFDEQRNFILDETDVSSVGGTARFYEEIPKSRMSPYNNRSKNSKRIRVQPLEYKDLV